MDTMTPFTNDAAAHNGTHNGAHLNGSQQPVPALFPMSSTPSWAEPEVDETEVERARLEAEITLARQRAAVARQRAASRDAEVQAALRDELVNSRETLSEIEGKYEIAISMVQEAARLEVARILEDARRQAALYLGAAALRQGGHIDV